MIATPAWAANRFVDATRSCTASANYSIANRTCTGSDGYSYTTVQAAVTAMSAGDRIILRGGTYTECVQIPTSKNPSSGSWTGTYNKMSSCGTAEGCATNEWAVLDGNQNCTAGWEHEVLGYSSDNVSGASDLKYWWFERFEIKNGGSSGQPNGPGIWINGGPFKMRYMYFHDNGKSQSGTCDYASTATMGYGWRDSVIEYNWFADNGSVSSNNNCKQIAWDENYTLTDNIPTSGLTITGNLATSGGTTAVTNMRNEIRYNYVTGGTVGIAPKHFVYRTGRDDTGATFSDTYNANGTKIHHNIVYNVGSYAIGAHGDFDQIYQNIVDTALDGVRSQYDWWSEADYGYLPMHKVAVYNNTAVNLSGNGFIWMGTPWSTLDVHMYGYLWNNICDDCPNTYWGNVAGAMFTPPVKGSNHPTMDYSNFYINKNYAYRPVSGIGGSLYAIGAQANYMTNAQFEAQTSTAAPRVGYVAAYNAGNLLWEGTTGANKYIPRAAHTIEAGVTPVDGGVGGNHPYLTGVTIPSFVGAVNPASTAWVAGVLGLASTAYLQAAGSGDPAWVDGGETPPPQTRRATGGGTIAGSIH
jgi:hypothetical protein